MPNIFCHLELHSTDTDGAKAFYRDLFGWPQQDIPMGEQTYTMFKTSDSDDDVHGGMTDSADGASAWLPYVLVEDVAAALEKAKGLGATVVNDKTEVPGMGWFAILTDPAGARLGLWETTSAS